MGEKGVEREGPINEKNENLEGDLCVWRHSQREKWWIGSWLCLTFAEQFQFDFDTKIWGFGFVVESFLSGGERFLENLWRKDLADPRGNVTLRENE